MVIKLKDLQHLEVMANLENLPVPPEPVLDVKALLKTEHSPKYSEKIAALCDKLRQNGFVRQAEGLENKFLSFKSATIHLYRVFDEDGEDVIDAAHPDGDVKVEDAEKDLGDVETIVSRHKKIVDIVNKQPTGKYAFKAPQHADAEGSKVVLERIADKFNYMAYFIDNYILKDVSEENVANAGDFYQRANNLYEFALKMVNDFKKPGVVVSTPDALQLIRNRMINSGHTAWAASSINKFEDIDVWIKHVCDMLQNTKPKTASLKNYIDEYNKILKNAHLLDTTFVGGVNTIYNMIKDHLGDAFEQAERTKDILSMIATKEDVLKSQDKAEKLNTLVSSLTNLLDHKDDINWSQVNSTENKDKIKFFKQRLASIQKIIPLVKGILVNFKNTYESSASSKVFHFLVSNSDYSNGIKALYYLDKSLVSLQNVLGSNMNTDSSQAKEVSFDFPGGETKSTTPVAAPAADPKSIEINKLNSWKTSLDKKQLDATLKQHIATWIEGQIKELSSATTPEQINKIVEEDKQFEAKGLI